MYSKHCNSQILSLHITESEDLNGKTPQVVFNQVLCAIIRCQAVFFFFFFWGSPTSHVQNNDIYNYKITFCPKLCLSCKKSSVVLMQAVKIQNVETSQQISHTVCVIDWQLGAEHLQNSNFDMRN